MDEIYPHPTRDNKNFTIISGIKYIGTSNTLYNTGILYCTPRMGRLGNSKYSVIKFYHNNSIHIGVLIGAVMVEHLSPINNSVESVTMVNHVSLMDFATDRDIPTWWPFERIMHMDNNIVCVTDGKIIDHLFIYPDFHPGIISNMDTTNIEPFERYWIIPRQLSERRDTSTVIRDRKDDNNNNITDFFTSSFANTIDSTRTYLHSKQATGININVQGFTNYSTVINCHSQNNPLPQPQQARNRNNHK